MSEIFKTNADLTPSNVGFKIESRQIENFIAGYLEEKGVTGIEAIVVNVAKEGVGQNIVVNAFAMFSPSSPDITIARANLNPIFKQKIGIGNYSPSDTLSKALKPIVPWNDGPQINLKLQKEKNLEVVYCKLNIFKCLAMMLDARANMYNTSIVEATSIGKGRAVLKVVKSVKSGKEKNSGADIFHAAASKLK